MANTKWIGAIGNQAIEVLNSGRFDHQLILLTMNENKSLTDRKVKLFRFELYGTKIRMENNW